MVDHRFSQLFFLRLFLYFVVVFISIVQIPGTRSAQAGVVELTGSFSFSKSNMGGASYQWSRRYELGIGYFFLGGLSEIEFSMQDVLYRTKIDGIEDTTFHDQIYSCNWVQYFAGKRSFIIPYIKLGIGQLNREASGNYWAGGAPPAIYDSLTAIGGVGIKFMFSNAFGVRAEGTTYLSSPSFSTWLDNFAVDLGFSIYL